MNSMNILAIDYGASHIGFAIGSMEVRVACPLRTVSLVSRAELLRVIKELVKKENIGHILIGDPLPAHGLERTSDARDRIRSVADEIATTTGVAVDLVDERFTTKQAGHLRESGSTASDHELSAMLILQTFFDSPRTD